jgi:hypothetical protein
MIRSLVNAVPVRVRPAALALVLALVAWPIVAITMNAAYPVHDVGGPELAVSPLARWSAAASAVFISAVVAGPIGGILVRRNVIGGGLATFAMALAVAVASWPLLPMLLGQQLGTACESSFAPGFSSSPCDPFLTTANLANDLQAVPFFWLAPFAQPVAVVILAIGISVWTAALATSGRPRDQVE